jgi:hypothetical protein
MNENLPLRSPESVDLDVFNALKSPDNKEGNPVKDMRRLFYKQVILDDETIFNVETIKVPGFIGIADAEWVPGPEGKEVSGHEDIVKFLDAYGLLVCTFTYHKDRYGRVLDLRWPSKDAPQFDVMEIFLKNEGHHSGVFVPANWFGSQKAFGSLNEPDSYHGGLFGNNGFMPVAQRLVFPEFVTKEQARGYTDSIICWMGLMNPFVEFASNDFNGGDPTTVCDRPTLKEFLKNCLLASLGSIDAMDWLNNSENKTYCAEFVYIGLNTPVFPFNKQGLSLVLDGDEAKVTDILRLQERQNTRRTNFINKASDNPQFQSFNIQMPIVPEDLPPLDVLMANHKQAPDPNSIPFPPFTLSQVLRRAFRTLLPRQKDVNNAKLSEAQARLFGYLEPVILKQLGLYILTPLAPGEQPLSMTPVPGQPIPVTDGDPRVIAIREFSALVQQTVEKKYDSYEAFDQAVDEVMAKADSLMGSEQIVYFIPPRIYVDLGQNDGDNNLPKGWGFHLETVGAMIYRGAIKSTPVVSQAPQEKKTEELKRPVKG